MYKSRTHAINSLTKRIDEISNKFMDYFPNIWNIKAETLNKLAKEQDSLIMTLKYNLSFVKEPLFEEQDKIQSLKAKEMQNKLNVP